MRKAGAQARYVLLNTAANHWKVPIEELSAAQSFVLHEKSGQKISFGELVPLLTMPTALPDFTEDQLKNPKDFQLIGKNIPRTEIPAKVNGTAQFAIDVRLPDMVYGALERGKLHGARPTLLNESEILAQAGVIRIVQFDYAIGLIASTLKGVLDAKKLLKIDWSTATSSGYHSQGSTPNMKRSQPRIKRAESLRKSGIWAKHSAVHIKLIRPISKTTMCTMPRSNP